MKIGVGGTKLTSRRLRSNEVKLWQRNKQSYLVLCEWHGGCCVWRGAGYLSGARQKTGVGCHSKLSMDLFELIRFILAVVLPRQQGNILCCISPVVCHVLVVVVCVTSLLVRNPNMMCDDQNWN